MGETGASSKTLERRVEQPGYRILCIGAGTVMKSTVERFTQNDRYIYLDEIILYSRNRDRLEESTVTGPLPDTGKDSKRSIRMSTPADYYPDFDQLDEDKKNRVWRDPHILDYVLNPSNGRPPDVVIIDLESEGVGELRKQGIIHRVPMAVDNLAEMKPYLDALKGYQGIVVALTNPSDAFAQAVMIQAGLNRLSCVGYQEIDSTTLRRLLYKSGKLFDAKEIRKFEERLDKLKKEGYKISEEDRKAVKDLGDIKGFGLGEKFEIERYDVHPGIHAYAVGAHGPNTVPVLSELPNEQLEHIIDVLKERTVIPKDRAVTELTNDDVEAVLTHIGDIVGKQMRYVYLLLREASYDLPPSFAEFIDALCSVAATQKMLSEQQHNMFAHFPLAPTASVYYLNVDDKGQWRGMQGKFAHIGMPVSIEPAGGRRVAIRAIDDWTDENENPVVRTPLAQKFWNAHVRLRDRYFAEYAKDLKIIEQQTGIDCHIELPYGERQQPPAIEVGTKKTLIYAQSEDCNSLVFVVDAETKKRVESAGATNPLLFRSVSYGASDRGNLKYVNIHRRRDDNFWVAGHYKGIDVISPEGLLRRFFIPSNDLHRVDSSIMIDDFLIASKSGTGLHAIDTTHPFEEWTSHKIEHDGTRYARDLKSHERVGYFLQHGTLKKILREEGGKWHIRDALEALGHPLSVTAYDIDQKTGIVYAVGKDSEGEDTIICMITPDGKLSATHPVAVGNIAHLAVGSGTDKSEKVYVAFVAHAHAYHTALKDIDQLKNNGWLEQMPRYSIEGMNVKGLTLDKNGRSAYLLIEDIRGEKGRFTLKEWEIEKKQERRIETGVTAMRLV